MAILKQFFIVFLAQVFFKFIGVVAAIFFAWIAISLVFGQTPDEYLYEITLEFENTSGSNWTGLLPIEVDALNLVDNNVIDVDGLDALFTDPIEIQVQGFTQGMASNDVNWWVYVEVADGVTVENKVFTFGPDVDDGFPFHPDNDIIVSVPDAASLDVTDLLTVDVRIEAFSCGTLLNKLEQDNTGMVDELGYGLFFIGTPEFTATGGDSGVGTFSRLAFKMTPTINADMCAFSMGNFSGTGVTEIRIENETTSVVTIWSQVLGDIIPVTPDIPTQTENNWIMIPEPFPVVAGTTYRIGCTCTGDRGDQVLPLFSASTANALFEGFDGTIGGVTYDPMEFFAASDRAGWSFVIPGAVAGEIIGVVDNEQVTGTWDGSDTVVTLTYNDPTLELEFDSVVQDTLATAGGLITNTTFPVLIGDGLEGNIISADIFAGVPSVLDLDFQGNQIVQTQEGNIGNSFTWLGDITDQSASTNDGEYTIISDTTGINITQGGIQGNPTPTPVSINGEANIVGSPDINPFLTPVPEQSGIIVDPIRSAANASNLPAIAWWLLIIIPVGGIVTARITKMVPLNPVPPTIAIIVIIIMTLVAGNAMAAWVAGGYGFYAVGVALTNRLYGG